MSAARCQSCHLTAADWHAADERGVRATVKLTRQADGTWRCAVCSGARVLDRATGKQLDEGE